MRLNLTLNGVLIASQSLDPARCKDEFYMQAVRQHLTSQNQDMLELIPAKPIYYIEVPSEPANLFYRSRN